jgi:hypothetical protein
MKRNKKRSIVSVIGGKLSTVSIVKGGNRGPSPVHTLKSGCSKARSQDCKKAGNMKV